MSGDKNDMALPLPHVASSRAGLSKSFSRFFRSTCTEFRLFLSKPARRRPWTIPFLLLVILVLLLLLFPRHHSRHSHHAHVVDRTKHSKSTHHSHVHSSHSDHFDLRNPQPCAWIYLEFNSKDGRYISSFFNNGGGFLQEQIRATQSLTHGYCALAFEGNRKMGPALNKVQSQLRKKAYSFHVYPGVIPGSGTEAEHVQLADAKDPSRRENTTVQTIDLAGTVKKLTLAYETPPNIPKVMRGSVANGHKGNVVVHINTFDIREAYMHLINLQAEDADGLMCQRIDRLVINLERLALTEKQIVDGVKNDEDVIRDWSRAPRSPLRELDARNGVEGLEALARSVSGRRNCRTVLHVIDENRRQIWPQMLSEREIYYSVLAGAPTFNERVGAQTASWVTAIPKDRLTFFTNEERVGADRTAAREWRMEVVQPNQPEKEQRLGMMQSWSHLVRLRETWDRYMKDDESIRWLALVDDDTFVFPVGMRQYLTMFDDRQLVWGGHGEQARVDNGDGGKFAKMLREKLERRHGDHCYLPGEKVPKNLKPVYMEYKGMDGKKRRKQLSHMCSDKFCNLGCAGVPQGAAILVSRALVEALRPVVEQCEGETSTLCKSCGSQRLYMCVNFYEKEARTLMLRGICRSPWKLEKREKFPFVLTFHGFTRYRGAAMSTKSIGGDMKELWGLGMEAEDRAKRRENGSFYVETSKVGDLIGCHGMGSYKGGVCLGPNGVEFAADDKPKLMRRRKK